MTRIALAAAVAIGIGSASAQPPSPTAKLDAGVTAFKMPLAAAKLQLIESRGGMTVKLSTETAAVSGAKFYIGDGDIALLLEATNEGIRLQGDVKLPHGHVLPLHATVPVKAGYLKAENLKAGDVYAILPGLVFELPK
jgi:hypothetical protein